MGLGLLYVDGIIINHSVGKSVDMIWIWVKELDMILEDYKSVKTQCAHVLHKVPTIGRYLGT